MRYFSLPNTSLQPSVIALGTGNYGSGISAEDSFRLLDEFAGAGGNLLDSAHIYAAWLPDGTGKSEKTIGQWLRKSGLRDKMIMATKGGHFDLATPEISRVRPECIDRDFQESQERLQLDTIDLYYLHRDDPGVPVAELLDVLQPHLRAGRIKAIGASNWSPERIKLANQEAKARGQDRLLLQLLRLESRRVRRLAPRLYGHVRNPGRGPDLAPGIPISPYRL